MAFLKSHNCACQFLHALTALCAKMLWQYQQALANLSPRKKSMSPIAQAYWSPTGSLDAAQKKKKFPASHQELNPYSSIIEPVSQSLYLLNYATGSCQYLAKMQLHRHGKLNCMLCMKRHSWIWHRAWCTQCMLWCTDQQCCFMFFKSVVSIQILKQTMNKNVKLGNKIGTVQQTKYITQIPVPVDI